MTQITSDQEVYYYYIVNGVEHFTSCEELAHKRADAETKIRIKKINKYT